MSHQILTRPAYKCTFAWMYLNFHSLSNEHSAAYAFATNMLSMLIALHAHNPPLCGLLWGILQRHTDQFRVQVDLNIISLCQKVKMIIGWSINVNQSTRYLKPQMCRKYIA